MKRLRRVSWIRAAVLLAMMLSATTFARSQEHDALEEAFRNPPPSALPRTWWHWTGGNVTTDGITKDLEWMQRVGIGGFQLADVSFGGGQTIEEPIDFGSPEWFAAVKHAAAEAERLGLEMAIFSSAGWSLTGGPWVRPEQAMKKLVWSETTLDGPQSFDGRLPLPPTNNGPIRNLGSGREPPDERHYGDSAVIAFRTPPAETDLADERLTITTNKGAIDGSALVDDDLNSTLTLEAPEDGGPAWVEFDYSKPVTMRAITLGGVRGIPAGSVLAGNDPKTMQTLVVLPGAQLYRQGQVRTFAFPATSARYFRIELTGAPLGPAETMSQAPPQPARQYVLREAVLHAGARVQRAEEKAGFSFLYEYDSVPTPVVTDDAAIDANEVIDLTSQMSDDGTLRWEVPPGRWTILRLGHSLTGAKNRPATAAGLGYEVDKLSREYVTDYYREYGGRLARALGPLYGSSLRYMLLDSWEAGMQNWTDDMLAEFRRRRGYDATPYLPVLTGRVVGSANVSDRFLWDFRRTLADMFADNFYGTMNELLHEDGLETYSEASGVSLEICEDTLLNKSKVDIPMGEFWFRDLHPRLMYYQDVRGAASAAHVYGKPIVGAESFTGGGYESPFALKQVGDYWMAQGINRIIFHTSAHQPLDTKPGNTMVGTHVHRNITWAEQAGPFIDYLARVCYLLQQGEFVADLVYLLPEGAPSTMPIWGSGLVPAPPPGYDFDYINADALVDRLTVDGAGQLALPSGAKYRLLVLPTTDSMRPELLRKIRELVMGGATVLGAKPTSSPSLMKYPHADREVDALASEIWGDLDGHSRTKRRVGKGNVVWGWPPKDVLESLEATADFECDRPLDTDVAWLHRRMEDADIYYVANLSGEERKLDGRFRVAGREAELWHADTGTIEPASYRIDDARTTVPLSLAEHELVFVVFRRSATERQRVVPSRRAAQLAAVQGPWDLRFAQGLGAPERLSLDELVSWTDSDDPGVRYFSGTATYTTTIDAPERWFATDTKLLLDLGTIYDLAEVSINGRPLGVAWKPPYRLEVKDSLHPGRNHIKIQVTNSWANRLLGDRLAPADQRVFDGGERRRGFGPPRDEPAPAGLLGPVVVLGEE